MYLTTIPSGIHLGADLEGKEHPNLEDIRQFLTGLRIVPPLGMGKKINIYFHTNSMKEPPETKACFGMLFLPLNMQTAAAFYQSFDKGVLYSLNYFGQE